MPPEGETGYEPEPPEEPKKEEPKPPSNDHCNYNEQYNF